MMKDSELLREVQELIRSGDREYICYAIDSIEAPYDQKRSLGNWVRKMIDPYFSFDTWYCVQHKEIYRKAIEVNENKYTGALKKARIQWLDWMIAYCEKEEANEIPNRKR